MSPRKPAAPGPPKAWRREAAGSYRSGDDRFTLEVITRQDRLSDAPSALPGWELLERGAGRRRIRVVADDLAPGVVAPRVKPDR